MTSAVGMSDQSKDMSPWLALAILTAVVPLAALGQGLVLSWVWGWFVVPLGVPALTFWHALGIGTVVAMFAQYPAPKKEGQTLRKMVSDGVAQAVVKPTIVAGIGWLFAWAGGLL